MPYIVKKVKGKDIQFGNSTTTILDLDVKGLENENKAKKGSITYKEILEIKSRLGHLNFAKNINYIHDEARSDLIKSITHIENFYESIWERTLIELMFITNYYLGLIENTIYFEKVMKSSGDRFEYWFLNNVKYTMSNKIKDFYINLCIEGANNSSLEIFEEDVTLKSKEIVKIIELQHIDEIKNILNEQWRKSYDEYLERKEKNEEKRKALIFE